MKIELFVFLEFLVVCISCISSIEHRVVGISCISSNEDRVVCISCSNQSLYLEGKHLVCKCPPASEEGEQDDLGTKEQARRRGR